LHQPLVIQKNFDNTEKPQIHSQVSVSRNGIKVLWIDHQIRNWFRTNEVLCRYVRILAKHFPQPNVSELLLQGQTDGLKCFLPVGEGNLAGSMKPWTKQDLKLECEDCHVQSEEVSEYYVETEREHLDLCPKCYEKRSQKEGQEDEDSKEESSEAG
jgi:hypothetical protein